MEKLKNIEVTIGSFSREGQNFDLTETIDIETQIWLIKRGISLHEYIDHLKETAYDHYFFYS